MAARWALTAAAVLAVAGCSGGAADAHTLAVQECKDSVQAQLAYPNDASFPTFDPVPTSDGHGGWHVSGSVTAKNGFGGSHTLRWTCTVTAAGDVNARLL